MVALTGLPIGYSVIVALTGLPIGYSVIVALTGLPIGYSVIVALTGLPIGYSVIVTLTGLPIGYSAIVALTYSSYRSLVISIAHSSVVTAAVFAPVPGFFVGEGLKDVGQVLVAADYSGAIKVYINCSNS